MVQVKISDSLMCGFEGTRILTVADVLRFFWLKDNEHRKEAGYTMRLSDLKGSGGNVCKFIKKKEKINYQFINVCDTI